MTTHRDFKRLVRGRMRKTGESYTSARSHLIRSPRASATAPTAPTASAAPAAAASDYARLAGIADAKLEANTGCTWERWVKALDKVSAHTWSHGEIAEHVRTKYKVPMWWTQAVTVGYERIKGIRAVGQQRDGTYDAGRSRTFPVAVARLFRAWKDPRTRRRWLGDLSITIRTAIKDRSMRVTWPDKTSVEVWFDAAGKGKGRMGVVHHKLHDQAAVTRAKADWGKRFDALAKVLKA